MPKLINLNGTTPAAAPGFMLGQWQRSSTASGTDPTSGEPYYDTSVEVPAAAGSQGVSVQTGDYTAVAGDSGKLLSFNGAGGPFILTLPSPPPSANWNILVENIGTATLTINPNGLEIDAVAATTLSLAQNEGVYIATDGTNYFTERGMGTGGGSGSALQLETNGVPNGSQTLLNLVAGAGLQITDDGDGDITIATGGGSGPVTAPEIRGSNIIASTSATSLTVPLPTGTAAGDFAIIFAATPRTAGNPTDWTQIVLEQTATEAPVLASSKVLTESDIATGSVTVSIVIGSPSDFTLAIVTFIGATGGIREYESASGYSSGSSLTLTNNTSAAVQSTDAAIYFASVYNVGTTPPVPTIVPATGSANNLQSSVGLDLSALMADQSMPGGALAVANNFGPTAVNGGVAIQVIVMGASSGGGTGATLQPVRENPSGTIDGTNCTFTLSQTPATGTLQYTRNGVIQNPFGSSPDFTISSNVITTATPLKAGSQPDWHFATYWA